MPNARTKKKEPNDRWNNPFRSFFILFFVISLTYVTFTVILHQSIVSSSTLNTSHGISSLRRIVREIKGVNEPSLDDEKEAPIIQRKKKVKEEGEILKKLQYNNFPLQLGEMEKIVHPASEVSEAIKSPEDLAYMDVPKFWDPLMTNNDDHADDDLTDADPTAKNHPSVFTGLRKYLGNFGERLMTLKEARSIGSFAKRKSSHTSDSKPEWLETVYVAIASYRDFQCSQTVESIFARAKYPERVRVSVVDQLAKNEEFSCKPQCLDKSKEDYSEVACQYLDQLDIFSLDAEVYGIGPVFARHIGQRMYRGEYFTMQIDAHVDFIQDWDESVIKQWQSAKNEMAVLTAYMSDITNSIDPVSHKSIHEGRPIMCKSGYESGGGRKHFRHGQQPEGVAMIKDQPMLEPFWAAGFSFARGHFVINVPYDQHLPMIFQGEEMNIGVRAFTYGYDFYAMQTQVCFHYYANSPMGAKRKKVPLFFDKAQRHGPNVETKAMERLNMIIRARPTHSYNKNGIYLKEIRQYGLGRIRSTDKFYETFGIDTIRETVEDNLCRFVGKPMHYIFLQHLRDDTMGIDYSKIDYKFVDPTKSGKPNWSHLLPQNDIVKEITKIIQSKGSGVQAALK